MFYIYFKIVSFINLISIYIENILWSFVDPLYKNFVSKSNGHFVYNKHKNTFSDAIIITNQIFANVNELNLINKNVSWKEFSEIYGGTCFGNCIFLINNIIKSKKILNINELLEIEKSEIFIKNSQAIQLIANISVKHNKTILNIKNTLNLDKKLENLGITKEEYENSEFKSRLNILLDSNIEKKDLDITLTELLNKSLIEFSIILNFLKQDILKSKMINPGLELIKKFKLIPIENIKTIFNIKIKKFTHDLFISNIKSIILFNNEYIKTRHSTFLEIDMINNIFIFYDNNRGYYQWTNFKHCFEDLKIRFDDEKCISCEIMIIDLN